MTIEHIAATGRDGPVYLAACDVYAQTVRHKRVGRALKDWAKSRAVGQRVENSKKCDVQKMIRWREIAEEKSAKVSLDTRPGGFSAVGFW
jgi:hypothetical protein